MWLGSALVFSAFLSGSIPYGLLLCRARGIDLRQVGSGNIGATNVARALGKKFGLLVLMLDVLKGLLPTMAARFILAAAPQAELWLAGTMVAGVMGHMFTPFLAFRGGKGVATGLGVMLAAAPLAGLGGLVLYISVYAVVRISSLGSIIGTLAAPAIMYLISTPPLQVGAALFISLLILIKHYQNIRRLVRGEEGRV